MPSSPQTTKTIPVASPTFYLELRKYRIFVFLYPPTASTDGRGMATFYYTSGLSPYGIVAGYILPNYHAPYKTCSRE
jgi:hypothetical protein